MTTNPDHSRDKWDELHTQSRFRPRYPSEPVVRFAFGRLAARDGPVLDLGAGAGRHSVMFKDLGHAVVAFDHSVEGLVHLRRAAPDPPPVVLGGMTHLPFASDSFAGVVAYGVLLYGDRAVFRRSVEEVRRVLRHGGWASIVTRTTDDDRFGMGPKIEEYTVLMEDPSTNERGLPMHFLDRAGIDAAFREFSEVNVDRIDHTAGGGALLNSDWVIEAQR